MELAPYLTPGNVLPHVHARDKWHLIEQMVEAALRTPGLVLPKGAGAAELREAVLSRERAYSTGVGEGFAFPHGRVDGLEGLALCAATLAAPLEYQSIDGHPVDFAFLTITPARQPGLGLEVVAHLSRLVHSSECRDALRSAADPGQLLHCLESHGAVSDPVLRARYIMRPVLLKVTADAPLRQVTHQMLQYRFEAIPVMDEGNRVVGEISCDGLFRLGIPDFFQRLKSVGFVRDFDPFEKYFEAEGRSTAGDAMSPDFAALGPDATLLELVYALVVQRRPKVYVVDGEGVCLGIVDRVAVLDRVIHG
ncbi:MAG: PTS sugar transporter subunit IIA [Gemmatimonadota bacterium]